MLHIINPNRNIIHYENILNSLRNNKRRRTAGIEKNKTPQQRMDPHQKFHWCIHGILKKFFRLIYFDVFEPVFRYKFEYFVVMFIFVASFFGCCYTIFTYDKVSRFFAIAAIFAVMQVSPTFNIPYALPLESIGCIYLGFS